VSERGLEPGSAKRRAAIRIVGRSRMVGVPIGDAGPSSRPASGRSRGRPGGRLKLADEAIRAARAAASNITRADRWPKPRRMQRQSGQLPHVGNDDVAAVSAAASPI